MDFDETDCAFSYRDPTRSDLSSTSLLLALPEFQPHALRVMVLLLLTLRDLRLGLGRGSATLRLLEPIRLKRLEDLPGTIPNGKSEWGASRKCCRDSPAKARDRFSRKLSSTSLILSLNPKP
jgi:hypothetical protein